MEAQQLVPSLATPLDTRYHPIHVSNFFNDTSLDQMDGLEASPLITNQAMPLMTLFQEEVDNCNEYCRYLETKIAERNVDMVILAATNATQNQAELERLRTLQTEDTSRLASAKRKLKEAEQKLEELRTIEFY